MLYLPRGNLPAVHESSGYELDEFVRERTYSSALPADSTFLETNSLIRCTHKSMLCRLMSATNTSFFNCRSENDVKSRGSLIYTMSASSN